MSFFLNPHRFAGTVQQGAFSSQGEASQSLSGAAIAASPAFSAGEATLTMGQGQSADGAISIAAESAATMTGASINASAITAPAEASMTLYAESSGAVVDAADFDGTNDYLTKLNSNWGLSDAKTGIFSCWFYLDVLNGTFGSNLLNVFNSTGSSIFEAWVTTASKLEILIKTGSSAVTVVDVRTSGNISTGAWVHVLSSWDASAAARHLYINGTSDKGGADTGSNNDAGYSSFDDSVVGAFATDGTAKWDGGMAELYFAPGQYLDLSVQANREKFRDSTGNPVDLGATGSNPTGTAPALYLHLDDAESANNFAVNRGTGGNFTVNGALTTFASSPSD